MEVPGNKGDEEPESAIGELGCTSRTMIVVIKAPKTVSVLQRMIFL
jgi:hypothetical protein